MAKNTLKATRQTTKPALIENEMRASLEAKNKNLETKADVINVLEIPIKAESVPKRRKTPRKASAESRSKEGAREAAKNEENIVMNNEYEDNKSDLNKLIRDAIGQWQKEFKNNIVKTDSINDLEKLIKLNFLLLDEREKTKSIMDKIVLKIAEIIKSNVTDPDTKISLFERIKTLNYEEFL